MKTIILFLFLLFACGIAISQEPQNPILELKEGVLVVRLRTQAAKIAKLEELLQAEDPETTLYNRLAYELGQTRQEVESENRHLVQAFKDQYRFSDVLFLFDTLAPRLKSENPGSIFLNDSLEVDPSLNLDNRPFLIAGMGSADPADSALETDALVVYDRNFDRLPRPFPNSSGVTGFRMWLESFTRTEPELEVFFYQKMVERLNRNFFKYFTKVAESKS